MRSTINRMAKTLVTGGTGFIGSHLVRQLAARGDELRLLVREGRDTSHIDDLDWERAEGDVTDRASVRLAMDDVSTRLPRRRDDLDAGQDRDRVFAVNVGGTRIVMEEALRAGALKVVHTSSCSAVGTAPPNGTIDETEPFKIGHLGIAYVNSKHDAETEAMRAAARGLPVVVVNPAFVLGPDDPTGTSNQLVRRLLLRRIPAYLDGGLNIVDVRDVASGHILADEVGEEGERYLLAGRNFTLQRLFADLSRIAGVPPPPFRASRHLTSLGRRRARQDRRADAGQPRRAALGDAVVDLLEREGGHAPGLAPAPARGDARRHGRVAARAARPPRRGPHAHRRRPARSRAPRPGSSRSGWRADGGRGPRGRAGSSTAAGPPPTSCARAARSRGS